MSWFSRHDVDAVAARVARLEYQFQSLLRALGYATDGNVVVSIPERPSVGVRVGTLEKMFGLLAGRVETLEERAMPPKRVVQKPAQKKAKRR